MKPRPSSPWWSDLPRPQWSKLEPIQQSQAWFEVYCVSRGVLAIYEPRHFEEVISYLILGDKKAVLLDTGLGIGDMKHLVGELTNLAVVVLNSHTHFDHVGDNHQFDTIYAMDTPFSRDRSKGIPPKEARAFVGEDQFWKAPPEDFSPEAYQIRPFTITHTVQDGDTMDLGAVSWKY
jgi:glyoxylase-like metal-dependent hydrolase (beta-lactamase superfamily II)